MIKKLSTILGTLALLAFHGTTTFAYTPMQTEVTLSSYYQNSNEQEIVLLGGATQEILKIDMDISGDSNIQQSTIVNDLTFTFEGTGTYEIEELRLYDNSYSLVDTVAWPEPGEVQMEVAGNYFVNNDYSFYLDAKFRDDFYEDRQFSVGVTDADIVSVATDFSVATQVETQNTWKFYSLNDPNNDQPSPSSFERIPMMEVYHDDSYIAIKRNLIDTDPDTIVASFGVTTDVDVQIEGIELDISNSLTPAVSNLKVKETYSNQWVQVSDQGNGEYILYPDTVLPAGYTTYFDIYLDPNQNIADGTSYSGVIQLNELIAKSVENNEEAVVSYTLDTSFQITVMDPSVNQAKVSLTSEYVDANLRYVRDTSSGNLVSQFTITANSDVYIKDLIFTVYEVEGNPLDYITKLSSGKGDNFTYLGNGEFKYNFNTTIEEGQIKTVNAYLDPSSSLPKGKPAKGYVDLTKATLGSTSSSTETVSLQNGWGSMFTIYEYISIADLDYTNIKPIEFNPVNNDRYEWPIEPQVQENPFSDIYTADLDRPEVQAAIALEEQDVIGGYLVSESPLVVEFRGDNEVNRAEAAKFLINSMGIDENDYCHYSVGSDVEVGKWYTKYVCTANELGLMDGYSDGTFRPANKVNTAEFAKMMYMAHQPDVDYTSESGEVWYSIYQEMAYQYDLFSLQNGGFEPASFLSRYDVALAIFTIMNI